MICIYVNFYKSVSPENRFGTITDFYIYIYIYIDILVCKSIFEFKLGRLYLQKFVFRNQIKSNQDLNLNQYIDLTQIEFEIK